MAETPKGPMCSTRCGPGWIDDGTLCKNKCYAWGPTGLRPSKSSVWQFARADPLEKLLQEGAEKLQAVKWGNPTGRRGRFDKKFWIGPIIWGMAGAKPQDVDYVLVLRKNLRPSDAYKAMFKQPSNWTFECATFTEAVFLYCLLQRLGPGKFDSYLKLDSKKTRGLVLFRYHRSTGLVVKSEKHFTPVSRSSGNSSVKSAADKAMQAAPTGNKIVFTNPDAPEESGFRNENTIKLEPDLFIAHGVHAGSAFATRSAIERKLMKVALRYNPQLSNVKQIVSVTWATQYDIK